MMAFPVPEDREGDRCPLCGAPMPHVIGASGCPRTDQLVPGLPPLEDQETLTANGAPPSESDEPDGSDLSQ